MKIKKLEPTQVSSNTLEFKVYRKVLKPSLKKMIAEHNSKDRRQGNRRLPWFIRGKSRLDGTPRIQTEHP